MSKAEKNEMMEVCELRKSFGYACHNCVYSDVCEEYKAKAKAKAEATADAWKRTYAGVPA